MDAIMTALSGNLRPHDSAVNGMMVDGVGTTGVWAPDASTEVRFRMRARSWRCWPGPAMTRGARAIDPTRTFLIAEAAV